MSDQEIILTQCIEWGYPKAVAEYSKWLLKEGRKIEYDFWLWIETNGLYREKPYQGNVRYPTRMSVYQKMLEDYCKCRGKEDSGKEPE